ncbi:MAG: hypothetical protein LBT79_03965 [Elusimicrobiota bacterium]|jgi:hypothetical protein|nr:hypothetical protein [Elusimicrobiota bacterium]
MKPCKCGSTEFVSNQNSHDVFELVEGKLMFKRTELAEYEMQIFCSKCYAEIKDFEIA